VALAGGFCAESLAQSGAADQSDFDGAHDRTLRKETG
jgi:hypothetical protein